MYLSQSMARYRSGQLMFLRFSEPSKAFANTATAIVVGRSAKTTGAVQVG